VVRLTPTGNGRGFFMLSSPSFQNATRQADRDDWYLTHLLVSEIGAV
jgi:hypothetical protein